VHEHSRVSFHLRKERRPSLRASAHRRPKAHWLDGPAMRCALTWIADGSLNRQTAAAEGRTRRGVGEDQSRRSFLFCTCPLAIWRDSRLRQLYVSSPPTPGFRLSISPRVLPEEILFPAPAMLRDPSLLSLSLSHTHTHTHTHTLPSPPARPRSRRHRHPHPHLSTAALRTFISALPPPLLEYLCWTFSFLFSRRLASVLGCGSSRDFSHDRMKSKDLLGQVSLDVTLPISLRHTKFIVPRACEQLPRINRAPVQHLYQGSLQYRKGVL
jgi:hypothetical protein